VGGSVLDPDGQRSRCVPEASHTSVLLLQRRSKHRLLRTMPTSVGLGGPSQTSAVLASPPLPGHHELFVLSDSWVGTQCLRIWYGALASCLDAVGNRILDTVAVWTGCDAGGIDDPFQPCRKAVLVPERSKDEERHPEHGALEYGEWPLSR